jgi:hypothetical protein
LSVKSILAAYGDDEKLMSYLPNVKAKGKLVCREFLLNVFNTLYPDVMAQIVASAKSKRNV